MSNHCAKCLCGSVVIECSEVKREFTTCHCWMCRQWGGTWMAAEVSGGTAITGREFVKVYDSSAWAERAFCANCGTHLYYKAKVEPEFYIPVSLFSNIDNFILTREIFYDQKPDYYCFENDTARFNSDDLPLAEPPGD